MSKVAVIGDGGWGTALAMSLYSGGVDTVLWSYSPEYAEFLKKNRENVKFLKGIKIPEGLKITADEAEVIGADVALFVAPCEYLREVAERFSGAKFGCIISATKGIENITLERPSEMLSGIFPKVPIGVLSGPSISLEVAKKFPTTVVFAAEHGWNKKVQKLFNTKSFRVYTASDVIGVELGGALKNVIAIAAGVSDGMGFGTNTKAALLTRGLAEIIRLGVAAGARKETFSGLSGIGDLATTCMSPHSRNRWFGAEIGKGRKPEEVLRETEKVVEGVATSRSAYELAATYSVDMPITRKVYEIIYQNKDPRSAVEELMTRDPKDED
ncbi:MAG: NAD(P)-dependent glycerol-3-phosphate dehydrogenase [Candidatus Omnitrophica bacterium]|nr:NAD(P)-dependent glycerol-3-phosphate dehydrogenase [Candidatus Omnitrophota bacterium]MBU1128938.1 NAD(P)-dependent glycerol-3-phosphate dehydrogenase [Candidatus Omnitrophota bacterium]MBU1785009.1 NAD(P)-dependent glycerol-3-phosphate dehydrogenase [Candidatus Omnitrophota bacterium]MBU1851907.1 NAD(P)-dependent glycerol-3-phosphate dehydrogenase [Candidatus Omnitrophota bacterium]